MLNVQSMRYARNSADFTEEDVITRRDASLEGMLEAKGPHDEPIIRY